MDHRQHVRATGDQARAVVEIDAADGHQRQGEARARLFQHLGGGCRRAGLGQRIEEAAERQIAGTLGGGLFGQFQPGVAGRADDGIGAELLARSGQRAIGLAQMHADAQLGGQRGIVIDDAVRAVLAAQCSDLAGFIEPARGIGGLVAVLQDARPAGQRRFHIRQQAAVGQQFAVGDGVESAHAYSSSRRRRGTYWPRPGCSASRRLRQV